MMLDREFRRVNFLIQKGEIAEARGILENILSKYPKSSKAMKLLIKTKSSPQKNALASLSPAVVQQLVVQLNSGDFSGVAKHAENLARMYPDSFILWNILGASHLAMNNLDIAIKHFSESTKLNPKYAESRNNLGIALEAKGRLQDAAQQLILATKINPEFIDAYWNLGKILVDNYKLDEAIECFEMALNKGGDKVEFHWRLGTALQKQGKFAEALKSHCRALNFDPKHIAALTAMGNCLLDQGNIESALEKYLRAMEVDPKIAEVNINCARLPTGSLSENTLEVLENFAIKNEQSLDRSRLLFFKANILRHRGKLDESFDLLRKANGHAKNEKEIVRWKNRIDATSKRVNDWSPSLASAQQNNRTKVLFVLGPSRSGKSTIENLISGCSGFLGIGEGWRSKDAHKFLSVSAANANIGTRLVKQKAKIQDILFFSEHELQECGANVVICTNPDIVHSAHRIYEEFPNSYFLFVYRDPHEVASEIFSKEYSRDNYYSYDAKSSVQYAQWYNQISSELMAKMTERTATINIEEVLTDQKSIFTRVEKLLGTQLEANQISSGPIERENSNTYLELFQKHLKKI